MKLAVTIFAERAKAGIYPAYALCCHQASQAGEKLGCIITDRHTLRYFCIRNRRHLAVSHHQHPLILPVVIAERNPAFAGATGQNEVWYCRQIFLRGFVFQSCYHQKKV